MRYWLFGQVFSCQKIEGLGVKGANTWAKYSFQCCCLIVSGSAKFSFSSAGVAAASIGEVDVTGLAASILRGGSFIFALMGG